LDPERKLGMKSVRLELPDKLAEELNRLVKAGWFRDEEEAIRLAVAEFLRQHRPELLEQFQREDIKWALGQDRASRRGFPPPCSLRREPR